MKKRVVILAKYFPPEKGGMEHYVEALAMALRGEFDVHVLAHARGRATQEEAWDGFRVARCATWLNALSQPVSPAMLTELRRLKPDIIQLNAPNAFANWCWRLAGRQAKLVVTHHADVIGRAAVKSLIYTPMYRQVAAAADRLIVFSLKNARSSIDLPSFPDKTVEIPQGLDPGAFAADDAMRAAAKAYVDGFANGAPNLAFIGRLIGYKGLDVLVEALKLLPGVHALVAGGGPLAKPIAEAARAAGIGDRFHMLGEINDGAKKQLLLGADMFVLPSISTAEAFGIVQVEAQMCGLPIVASNLASGVTDVTVDGVTGLLCQPGDPQSLADAIQTLLADAGLRDRMGAAGRARALERFSVEAFNRANLKLFREVSGQTSAVDAS